MNQFQCEVEGCGKIDALVFECNYCGRKFCAAHHLPESHNCKSKPKTAPPYVRPQEVPPPKPPNLPPKPPTKQHSKNNLWKKILAFFVVLIIVAFLVTTAYPLLQQNSVSNKKPSATPTSTTSYVEVDYQTVGWFYATPGSSENFFVTYNYTYLILNVTITNHEYSQVNVNGADGFSVSVNGGKYMSIGGEPAYLYNGTISDFWGMQKIFHFNSGLPISATLLDTGTVSGIIVFQFGSPVNTNIYPQPTPQPQIINQPFTLQYSVTYGKDGSPLFGGPYATVIINQTE
jgi:hypothetical protein